MTFDELLSLVFSCRLPVCSDSRLVSPGDVYVAVTGTQFDGHDFINQAVKKGANYIVCEKIPDHSKAEIITVADSANALGLLAQASYGYPSSKLINLAVTGTNGKTTVTFLVRSVIKAAKRKCGLIGTVINDTASETQGFESSMTTPDALEIVELAGQMVKSGAEFMVIEASSHSLKQKRLAGIDFKAAAFTNLTGEHLDYHKTMDDYLAAKMLLFEQLYPDATAVLNKQDAASEKIAKKTKAEKLFYAVDLPADVEAQIEKMDIDGTVFLLKFRDKQRKIKTPLIGVHNVSNHLAAAGLCFAAGFDIETVAAGLSTLDKVPGRLERVDGGREFTVLVDYAHTDDALANVLETLKPICRGRLIVVFGCGGDRDRSKRPRMAEVAERFADIIIVTSDNPRTENPDSIIEEIKSGFSAAVNFLVEPDRKKAIFTALAKGGTSDIILIAGKGHENYQVTGNGKIHFSDVESVREFLGK